MMLYVLKSAITLALLYSCFFFFLSKETFHRFNRCMLMGIMLVSLVVPLLHFTTEHPTVVNEELYQMQSLIERDETPVFTAQREEAPRVTWVQVVESVYLAGVAAMLLLTLVQAFSLIRLMRGGLRHTDSQGNTVVLLKGDVTPFSVFRYIVMNVHDYEQHRQHILTHEQEHIRLGHTYDLLFMEAMKTLQWFNPFVWFISRDLKAVHEYEADQAVIHQGIDAKQYQQLLVTKVAGIRLQPFTNNLGHGSLKKRILMMYQKPSNRWLMLKALCAIPVVALTLNAFATPSGTDPVEDMVTTLNKDEDPPIIVVDGKIVSIPASLQGKTPTEDEDALKALGIENKEDVASVTFLKGTPATTIFGDCAKNGAIVIETKAFQALPKDTVVYKGSAQWDDDDKIFEICEEPASYVGGVRALATYIDKNLKHPEAYRNSKVAGRVIVSFVVEKDGSLSNFKIVRSLNDDMDKEAVRLLQSMPKWQPGKQRGRIVRSLFTLPVVFYATARQEATR